MLYNIKKDKINLLMPRELTESASRVAKELNKSLGELVKKVLKKFINNFEKRKLEKQIREGYEANYNYYLKTDDEFKFADLE